MNIRLFTEYKPCKKHSFKWEYNEDDGVEWRIKICDCGEVKEGSMERIE